MNLILREVWPVFISATGIIVKGIVLSVLILVLLLGKLVMLIAHCFEVQEGLGSVLALRD